MNGEPPEFHPGGLVTGPGGEDSVPVWIDLRCEQVFTRKQVERLAREARETAHGNEDET